MNIPETKEEAIEFLNSIHYKFFMENKRFWYDKILREADTYIVKAISELRQEINQR